MKKPVGHPQAVHPPEEHPEVGHQEAQHQVVQDPVVHRAVLRVDNNVKRGNEKLWQRHFL